MHHLPGGGAVADVICVFCGGTRLVSSLAVLTNNNSRACQRTGSLWTAAAVRQALPVPPSFPTACTFFAISCQYPNELHLLSISPSSLLDLLGEILFHIFGVLVSQQQGWPAFWRGGV